MNDLADFRSCGSTDRGRYSFQMPVLDDCRIQGGTVSRADHLWKIRAAWPDIRGNCRIGPMPVFLQKFHRPLAEVDSGDGGIRCKFQNSVMKHLNGMFDG